MNYKSSKVNSARINGGWWYGYDSKNHMYELFFMDDGTIRTYIDSLSCRETDIPKEIWRFFQLKHQQVI